MKSEFAATPCGTRKDALPCRSLSFLFFLCALLASELHAQPVAMITSIGGKAVQVSGEKQTEAALGAELQSGDALEVKAGTASLVFLQGEFLEVKAGERLTLGADRASSSLSDAAGTRGVGREETITVSTTGLTPSQGKDYLSQLAVMSGVRGDPMPVAVSPRLAVSDTEPVFVWFDTDSVSAGQTRSYTIIVRDHSGAILFRKDVDGIVCGMNAARFDKIGAVLKAKAEQHFSWAVFEKGKTPQPLPEFDAAFAFVDETGMNNAAAKRSQFRSMLDSGSIDEQSFHTLMTLYYIDERERLFADAVPHLLTIGALPEGRAFSDAQLGGILPRFGNQVAVAAVQYFESRRNSP